MKIEENYSLEKHNTFHLNVKTRWFMEYSTEEELSRILHDEYVSSFEKVHIGAGSNLLFLNDYSGVVLHSAIKGIDVDKENDKYVFLRVGAGVVWDDLVAYAVDKGLGGIENLSLIPGEVGAAAIQNIGAYGAEIKDVIESVEAFEIATGHKRIFTLDECAYGYRSSIFKKELVDKYIVTYLTIRLSKKPQFSIDYKDLKEELSKYSIVNLSSVRQAVIDVRTRKLPDTEVLGNAGSFFMNPTISENHYESLKNEYPSIPSYALPDGRVKIPAAWLIEQCGFKGKVYGQAAVYEHQALVLVNLGGAVGSEIALLAEAIRETVAQRFGIQIEPEVKYIG
jgi:UDP-N-acetylmuramate dehydrogenase